MKIIPKFWIDKEKMLNIIMKQDELDLRTGEQYVDFMARICGYLEKESTQWLKINENNDDENIKEIGECPPMNDISPIKTPWEVIVDKGQRINIVNKNLVWIASCDDSIWQDYQVKLANAKFIVKCVNNHDKLVDIIRLYINQCELTGDHCDLYDDAKETLKECES